MSPLMCMVVVVFTAGNCLLPEVSASCSWTKYPKTNIAGGVVQATDIDTVSDCQAACLEDGECQSVDFNPTTGGCWLLYTQANKKASNNIDHYDYVCGSGDPCSSSPCHNGASCSASSGSYSCSCASGYSGPNCDTASAATTDIVSTAGNTRAFKTNYKGDVSDFYSAPNGVKWDFQLANFGFNWPNIPLVSLFVAVQNIKFGSSDNLDYFRVVFTKTNGVKVTSDPIYSTDSKKSLNDITDIKRIDFYFSPKDYRRNVTITNLEINCCAKAPLVGCIVFNLFKYAVGILSLGFIRPGSGDSITASVGVDYPFIDIDLSTLGIGTSAFAQVSYGRTDGFDTVGVNIWDGATVVPVYRKDGVATDTFNYADGINFKSGLRGSRIRTTIYPRFPLANQGISGSIGFSAYSVYIYAR